MNETSHSNTTSYVGIHSNQSDTICCKGLHFCCFAEKLAVMTANIAVKLLKAIDGHDR
jgi:hypothetical protein